MIDWQCFLGLLVPLAKYIKAIIKKEYTVIVEYLSVYKTLFSYSIANRTPVFPFLQPKLLETYVRR